MAMIKSWEEGRAEARAEGRAEGRAEARAEARIESQVESVLTVLQARGIAVSDAARERIRTQTDLELLKRWLVKAVDAKSIDDVFDDPRPS